MCETVAFGDRLIISKISRLTGEMNMNNTVTTTTSNLNNLSSNNYLWVDPFTIHNGYYNPATYTTWLSDLWISQAKETGTFPPYDITRNEDSTKWKLTMALAGFSPDDLDIVVEQNVLSIKGEVSSRKSPDDKYSHSVHKGIAERSFTRKFTLGEHVEVKSVSYKNGMLELELELVLPESKKPRKLKIDSK